MTVVGLHLRDSKIFDIAELPSDGQIDDGCPLIGGQILDFPSRTRIQDQLWGFIYAVPVLALEGVRTGDKSMSAGWRNRDYLFLPAKPDAHRTRLRPNRLR